MWYRVYGTLNGLSDEFLEPLRAILPEGLITNSSGSFWISAYSLAGTEEFELPISVSMGNGYLMLFQGDFKYYHTSFIARSTVPENESLDIALRHLKFEELSAPNAPYMMLIFPCTAEQIQQSDFMEQMRSLIGLLGTFNGLNFLYEKLFDSVVDFNTRKLHLLSPSFPSLSETPINLSNNYLAKIQTAYNQLNTLVPVEKNKFDLALRWYSEAQRREDSVDSFIKLWVALETIAMPTSDVRDLNVILKEIYSLHDQQTANQTYKAGRLQGLRSQILHNGVRARIKDKMLDYMEALFTDVLLYKLRLEPEYRLRAISERVNIGQLLSSALS